MKRRSGRLRNTRFRRRFEDSSFNPMDGIANLADVMLVLACGLMLSLIINWNVDVGRTEKLVGLSEDTKLTAIDDAEKKMTKDFKNGQGFEEMGVVYKDPSTGKLYVVSKGEE